MNILSLRAVFAYNSIVGPSATGMYQVLLGAFGFAVDYQVLPDGLVYGRYDTEEVISKINFIIKLSKMSSKSGAY